MNPPNNWSPDNSSNIDEVGDQGVSEVMTWVEFFDGRVLPISPGLPPEWISRKSNFQPLRFLLACKESWSKPTGCLLLGNGRGKGCKEKPKTIVELKAVVENFVGEMSKETLRNVADNFIKQFKMCHQQDGGHFVHLK